MRDDNALVERYMAIWNEPDEAVRASEIAELWAPEGVHQILDFIMKGHATIAGRVGRAYVQWVEQQNHLFRSAGDVMSYENVVTFHWEMVPAGKEEVISVGFDFLILDDQGRILVDHQFNEPPVLSAPLNALADRCVAVWNEPDGEARGKEIAQLWAADRTLAAENSVTEAHTASQAEGLVLTRSGNADGHPNAARYSWRQAPALGTGPTSTGFDFLLLDDDGHIVQNYRFTHAPTPSARILAPEAV
jgi:hypothetical protein